VENLLKREKKISSSQPFFICDMQGKIIRGLFQVEGHSRVLLSLALAMLGICQASWGEQRTIWVALARNLPISSFRIPSIS